METKRFGFKMKMLPGFKEEYKKRHSEIWPELVGLLKNEGIGNYSIFLDEETNTLFAYQEQSGENSSQTSEIQRLLKSGGNIWLILWKQILIILRLQSNWKRYSTWNDRAT